MSRVLLPLVSSVFLFVVAGCKPGATQNSQSSIKSSETGNASTTKPIGKLNIPEQTFRDITIRNSHKFMLQTVYDTCSRGYLAAKINFTAEYLDFKRACNEKEYGFEIVDENSESLAKSSSYLGYTRLLCLRAAAAAGEALVRKRYGIEIETVQDCRPEKLKGQWKAQYEFQVKSPDGLEPDASDAVPTQKLAESFFRNSYKYGGDTSYARCSDYARIMKLTYIRDHLKFKEACTEDHKVFGQDYRYEIVGDDGDTLAKSSEKASHNKATCLRNAVSKGSALLESLKGIRLASQKDCDPLKDVSKDHWHTAYEFTIGSVR